MLAVVVVLGAEILIHLHQPLSLLVVDQHFEHLLFIAEDVMLHEAQ